MAYELGTHGLGRMSIWIDDPDGYHIELTVAMDDREQGRREIEKRGLLREGGATSPSPFALRLSKGRPLSAS